MVNVADVKVHVGLELSEFKEQALAKGAKSVRVVERDGKPMMVTKDLRKDRVNVAVKTEGGKEIVSHVKNVG